MPPGGERISMTTRTVRAPRNRTLRLTPEDTARLRSRLVRESDAAGFEHCLDRTVHGDSLQVLAGFSGRVVDLLLVDPPYNLAKSFNGATFPRRSIEAYEAWLHAWISLAVPILKSSASVYVCSEWRSSGVVQRVLEQYFHVRNRITWEREKGRGALRNWKNCAEDIWYGTVSNDYHFDVEAVKQKRRVVAPYRDAEGKPKDWKEEGSGSFRITHPSNLWTDISIPFWSMSENTEHPTQKPEKLVAKLILASSRPGDVVLDPFLGSGTTSVVAKKLGRRFLGIEREETYCLLAEKRLEAARFDGEIQGYSGGCFWERNTLALQNRTRPPAIASSVTRRSSSEGDS
jgi:site-specific DNA-methyltransferase (adenine-specific)